MNRLTSALNDYLGLRRSLGFKLNAHGFALRNFVRFLHSRGAKSVSIPLAVEWAQQSRHANPAHWARLLGMARGFAQYLSARDPRTEVPPHDILVGKYRRTQPYIYTANQIQTLVLQAAQMERIDPLRPSTYSTLFGLMAVTGMRVCEIVALDRQDVDLKNGILAVRQSKFGKSRFIPLHQSTLSKLHNYSCLRDRLVKNPSTPSFFMSVRGVRITHWMVRHTFVKLSRRIGFRGASDSHGPRLHDLRHTFAVRTLINWHSAGADLEQRLPVLSTYLGHVKVSDTYWYLTAVPELMGAVNVRLEHFLGDLS